MLERRDRMARTIRGTSSLLLALLTMGQVAGREPPVVNVRPSGPPVAAFVPSRDGCDGNDVPDEPARAFRRADGGIVLFGLHYTNHPLIGPDVDHLTVSCRSAFAGHGDPDPAAYNDRAWIAATWTTDGRRVDALVHHEYQANQHPGRCRFPDYMQCWFNTVLAVRSADGGATFAKPAAPVMASAPFPQQIGQGRHRGFFNPSNIVADGGFFYMMASTTGWEGQGGGVCLFRTADPGKPASWRAFDGARFAADLTRDPYRDTAARPSVSCQPVAPFPAPVGSLARLRGTGSWLAVFQAQENAGVFPVSGLYTASSSDLLHWSAPRLLLAGSTNYDNPCRANGRMLAYPALIDRAAPGRNFDSIGSEPELFFASLKVDGCTITADRTLMRMPLRVAPGP